MDTSFIQGDGGADTGLRRLGRFCGAHLKIYGDSKALY